MTIQETSSHSESHRNSLASYPIVEATRVTGNFLASNVPIVVATPINVRQVSPTFVESQAQLPATDVIVGEVHDEEALGSKTLSIALFLTILAGCISPFFMPGISILLEIIAIVIANILRNGSLYTNEAKPHVKKWATSTLVAMVFVLIIRLIASVYLNSLLGKDTSNPFRISSRVLLPYSIVYYCLIILALIFSGCIACDRRHRQRSTY